MTEARFFGARIGQEEFGIIEKVANEENVDRTAAIKILIGKGWKEFRLEKAIQEYRDGKVSIDRAAKIAGLTVHEMMDEALIKGIKVDESISELRRGVELILK